jgi:Polyketide cyclase / dehydrase and lipid transport
MPPIVSSAEIERPAAEVFAYATDPARFSEWQKGVVDGHMDGLPDGTQTPAVGAKCVTTRRIGGASRPSTSELTHIDPPRTWGVLGTDGPIRAAVEVLVEPLTASSSRLTISVDFTGHGIGKILVPLMVRREARKEMPGNMAALKQKIEADSAANPRDLAGDGQDDV